MCPPAIAAAVATAAPYITAASAAYSLYSGYQGARAQSKYQKALGINAAKDAANKNAMLGLGLSQSREAAAEDMFDAQRQSRAAIAANTVAAGEAGVSGLSVDALNANFARQADFYRSRVMRNLEFKEAQFAMDVKGVGAQYDSRALEASKPIDMSFIGTGLNFATQIPGQYKASQDYKKGK